MQTVIQDFEGRVQEVQEYFKLLKQLEEPDAAIHNPRKRGARPKAVNDVCIKVMRATAFLLVYNLVESAIRSGIDVLYKRIELDEMSFEDVRNELQRIWIGQRHRSLDRSSASPGRYHEVAEEIASDIVARSVVSLSTGKLSLGGSLDARAIREVCKRHGVAVSVHHRALGGAELSTVKSRRNALAHGHESFAECGQQYTVADLERIKQQSVIFVRSILRNIEKYVAKAGYAA